MRKHWVNKEIKRKFEKYLKTNKNENTTYKNLGDAKVIQRHEDMKFIAINPDIKKRKKDLRGTNFTSQGT